MSANKMTKIPLRERKKEMLRKAIRTAAVRMFLKKGFDDTTVAEIADAANVSVKTMFCYYRSKEELLFQENWFENVVLDTFARTENRHERAKSVVDEILADFGCNGSMRDFLEIYRKCCSDSATLRSKANKVWGDYERRLVEYMIAEEGKKSSTLRMRLMAAQYILLFQAFTWSETLDLLKSKKQNAIEEVKKMLYTIADQIDHA